MSQKFCRGCAGTGISAKASPREVQAAMLTIKLVRETETTRVLAHARVDAWETAGGGVHVGRLAMSGPLAHVIEHVNKRLADGWEIAPGSLAPDPKLVCPWCDGFGVAGKVLTVHSMTEAVELGGTH